MPCRGFSSILGLRPLDASSVFPSLPSVTTRMSPVPPSGSNATRCPLENKNHWSWITYTILATGFLSVAFERLRWWHSFQFLHRELSCPDVDVSVPTADKGWEVLRNSWWYSRLTEETELWFSEGLCSGECCWGYSLTLWWWVVLFSVWIWEATSVWYQLGTRGSSHWWGSAGLFVLNPKWH